MPSKLVLGSKGFVVIFAFAIAVGGFGPTARATTYTWNNAGTDWNTAANWTTAVVPGNADVSRFNSATYGNLPSLSAASSASGLWMSGAGSLSVGGSGLTLYGTAAINGNSNAGIQMDAGAGSLTINAPLTMGAAQTWYNNASSGVLTAAGSVTNGGFLLTASGSGSSLISGLVSGNGGLTKAGGGRLTLSNANTYLGPTTLSAGVLSINTIADGGAASALGASGTAAANLVIGAGTLQYTGASASTNRNFTLSSGTDTIEVTQAATTLTFTKVNGSSIGGSYLVKNGPGTLQLNYGPSGSGYVGQMKGIVVNSGTLSADPAHSPQFNVTAVNGLQVAAGASIGAILSIEDDTAGDNQVALFRGSSGTASCTGQLIISVGLTGVQTKTFAVDSGVTALLTGTIIPFNVGGTQSALTMSKSGNGLLVIANSDTVPYPHAIQGGTLQIGNGGNSGSIINSAAIVDNASLAFARSDSVNFSNAISGSGSVVQLGSGTTILSGSNTYSGTTNVNGGTLQLSGAAAYLGGAGLNLAAGMMDLNGNSITASALSGTGGLLTDTSNGAATTTLTISQSTNTLYSGTLADGASQSLALTKSGSGKLTLTGSNTFSGPTNVGGGTLAVNGSLAAASMVNVGATATLAGSGVVNGNATLASGGVINLSGGTIGGTLAANGGNWNGTGTVSGLITVNGNVCGIGSGAYVAASGGIALNGGTLCGQGTVSGGTTTLNAGATIAPGATAASGNIGTLTLAHLVTSGGGNVSFDLSGNTTAGGGVNDLVAVGGNLSLGGTTTVSINAINYPLASGSYTLFTYGGALSGYSAGSLALADTSALTIRTTYQFDAATTPGSILLSISGNAANLNWVGGNAASWDNAGGTTNWFNTGTAALDQFVVNDNVNFTNANSGTVTINAAVAPSSVTVSGPYLFSGTGKITGATAVTVQSPAALTISNTNDYTGGTNLQGGTITLGTHNGLPSGGTVTFGANSSAGTLDLAGFNQTVAGLSIGAGATAANQVVTASTGNSTLTFNAPGTSSVFAGTITDTAEITGGTLGLTIAGGTLDASNGSTIYSGPTNINGGLLIASSLPSSSSIAVAASGSLNLTGVGISLAALSNSGNVYFTATSGTVSLAGLSGGGSTTFAAGANVSSITAGQANFNGPAAIATLSGGTANFNGPGAQVGVLGNAVLNIANGMSLSVLSGTHSAGTIAGPGGLAMSGSGLLVLAATESYTGGTTVNSGTLQIGNGIAGGDGYLASPSIVNNASLLYNSAGYAAYSGAISGSGGLTKAGSGTLLLSGNNTYSGTTTISAGTLRLAAAVANAPLAFNFSSGTSVNNGTMAVTLTNSAGPVYSSTGGPEPGLGAMTLANSAFLLIQPQSGNLPNLGGLSSNSYTVAMWIKTTLSGAALLSKGSTTWSASGVTFYLTSGSGGNNGSGTSGSHMGGVQFGHSWIGGNTAVNTGNWTFVSMVRAGGTSTVYVNGVPEVTGTNMDGGEQGTPQEIRLGWASSHDGAKNFNGSMSGIYVYDSALSAAQLQTLMLLGPAGGGNLPSGSTVQLTNSGAALDVNATAQNIPSLNGVAGTRVYLGNGSLTLGSDDSNSAFAGQISDSGGASNATGGSLAKSGGGTLLLTGTNTYTGNTTVNGGTLQLGSGMAGQDGTLSNSGKGIVNNSALIFDNAGTQTATYGISGGGSFTKIGGGTLILGSLSSITTSTSTFTGDITINGGKLIAAATSNSTLTALGQASNTRTITVNAGSTLEFDAPNVFGGHFVTRAPALVISGGTVTNADPIGLGLTNNALNNVTLSNGLLTATAGQHTGYGAWNVNGTVTSSGTSAITTSDPIYGTFMLSSAAAHSTTFNVTDGTLTVSAPVVQDNTDGDIDSLVKTGNGVMVLSASNNYTGGTMVKDGTLIVTNASAIVDGTTLILGDPLAIPTSIVPSAAAVVTPVPEPASLALLVATAIAGAGIARRRAGATSKKDAR
jgi:autotransporter-associated beta strand protein